MSTIDADWAADYLSRLLHATRWPRMPNQSKPIVCQDGFGMSVQASDYHYCTPQNNIGPWTKFEIGFPDAFEPLLMPYIDDDTSPTKTVYYQVPAEIVMAVIEKHGGLKR